MELREKFEKAMLQTENMALATSVENIPNVRVVTFGYDTGSADKVYFTTFKGSNKIEEFAQNPNVTFVLLPESIESDTQVRIHGTVHPSERSIEEIAPFIIKKAPDFAETVQHAGPMLEVYEIRFAQAALTIGMTDAVILTL